MSTQLVIYNYDLHQYPAKSKSFACPSILYVFITSCMYMISSPKYTNNLSLSRTLSLACLLTRSNIIIKKKLGKMEISLIFRINLTFQMDHGEMKIVIISGPCTFSSIFMLRILLYFHHLRSGKMSSRILSAGSPFA